MTTSSSKFAFIQQIGRSLMLPIAVLPIAGLLLRLGQDDMLNLPFMAAAGDAIFGNLGILFAIGIAVGFAKENHGAAGLSGAVGFFVTTAGMKAILTARPVVEGVVAIDPTKAAAQMSIPIGILMGLLAGWLYNRFKDIKLPEFLAFFGGRRFVPIVAGFCGLGFAVVFGFGFPTLSSALDLLARGVETSGNVGLFLYGVFNRILIVTGLHHIINNVAWFILGDYNGATGDLKRFFAGDPNAGAFMSGFFPVMMFGLPAACLAIFTAAKKEKRPLVGGLLFSMALTSFLTGITEPIEFTFMFLAPVLYIIHALLTGLAMVLMNIMNIKLGFGFSAGLFDYVINWKLATNPIMLFPVGAAYFALYYVVFYAAIVKFNLKTPGREDDTPLAQGAGVEVGTDVSSVSAHGGDNNTLGAQYVSALGGAGNIKNVDSCTTRLRLTVADNKLVNEATLKALGARGVMKQSDTSVQVIIGPQVEQIETLVKEALKM